MDVFTPTSMIYPFGRKGGISPTISSSQENGTDTYRQQWMTGATILSLEFKGTRTRITADLEFIEEKSGSEGFKFKDPYKYLITGEAIGNGNGSDTVFYFENKYTDIANMSVYVNAVLQTYTTDYTVDSETGAITFTSPPGGSLAVTATYEFYKKYFFKIQNIADLEIQNINPCMWSFALQLVESII